MNETAAFRARGQDSEDESSEEESLEIDDSLPLLERIKKYLSSNLILHRLHVVRDIYDCALQVGYEKSLEVLLPILEQEPVIRQALAEQHFLISQFFVEKSPNKEGYRAVLLPRLLPLLAKLVVDHNPQVRQSSAEALVGIAAFLAPEDIEPKLMPIVVNLATDASEEEHRVEACQLFNALAPLLGRELCIKFASQHLPRLSKDSAFRVRKAVAANLSNVVPALGPAACSSFIVSLFTELSKDEIWGVRKACAESLVALAEGVDPEERKNLIPIFQSLASDPSRWVRSAAFQNLGPFIATFRSCDVSEEFLRYYTDMASDQNDAKSGDSDAVTYCAFSFPGVLQTVGKERWEGELAQTYFTLVKDLQWKVRRTLSYSFHEVARILGTDVTEEALLPVFELFLHDLDEVKVGVIRHLADFLAVLSPEKRKQYLSVISDINAEDNINWRFRRLLARQLGKMSTLYPSDCIREHLIPVTMQLCKDQVAAVRKAANMSIGTILTSLNDAPEIQRDFIDQIKTLAAATYYADRVIFVSICENLLEHLPNELFQNVFLPVLLALARDRVANVRVAVMRFLVNYKKRPAELPSEQAAALQDALDHLRKDPDRDVRHYLALYDGLPPPGPITRAQTLASIPKPSVSSTPSVSTVPASISPDPTPSPSVASTSASSEIASSTGSSPGTIAASTSQSSPALDSLASSESPAKQPDSA